MRVQHRPLECGRVVRHPPALPARVSDESLPSMADLFGEEADAESVQCRAVRRLAEREVDFLDGDPRLGAAVPALECLFPEPPVLDRKFITLTRAQPLPGRRESHLRLAIMQAVARLRACGIPILRWHSDRAKEFSSKRLAEWMKTQGIVDTKSAPGRSRGRNERTGSSMSFICPSPFCVVAPCHTSGF